MHLLDADTLTHLHAEHPRVVERLRRCDDPEIGIRARESITVGIG